MGKGGRIFCIFTPYVLTVAALICIIVVGLGCTNSNSKSLSDLYFIRVNMKDFSTSPETKSQVNSVLSSANVKVPSADLDSLMKNATDKMDIKDFYSVGVWGYCSGNVTGNTYKTTFCSKPKAAYYFNPFEVWGLQDSGMESQLPKEMDKAISTYKSVSKWMFIAYIVAFIATIIELLIGLFAICSRWGSCVTSLVAGVSFFFTAAASATSTALFAVLTPMLNKELEKYHVYGNMGKNMLATTWLATAFSLAAALFWVISSCCCSGRSPYNKSDRHAGAAGIPAEKAPYTYEPLGPNGHYAHDTSYPAPTHGRQNAYEPFRHA